MRSDHKVEQREPKMEVGVRPSMPKIPTNRVDRFEIILNHSKLILVVFPFFMSGQSHRYGIHNLVNLSVGGVLNIIHVYKLE